MNWEAIIFVFGGTALLSISHLYFPDFTFSVVLLIFFFITATIVGSLFGKEGK